MLPAATTSRHFVSNLHGAVTGPLAVGFNVFDTGSSLQQVESLPRGVRALVWLGQKCPTPVDDAFRSTVHTLATSSKVLGYYLSDEPHIADCPGGPRGLASRATFIAKVTSGTQKSFIVLSRSEDYGAFRPSVTHVNWVGLDPYPCSIAHPECLTSKIDEKVDLAIEAGIPRYRIVPVYQAFGQGATTSHYYNLPTVDQLATMVARWALLIPHPHLDYTYGWGHQASSNPTLDDSAPLKDLLIRYFAS